MTYKHEIIPGQIGLHKEKDWLVTVHLDCALSNTVP